MAFIPFNPIKTVEHSLPEFFFYDVLKMERWAVLGINDCYNQVRKKKIGLFKYRIFDITMSTYLSYNSQNDLFRLKHNSDSSIRKGEHVYKTIFWYMIGSTLIILCKHRLISMLRSGYSIDVKIKNM